jgi:rod shape-determining protein MreD
MTHHRQMFPICLTFFVGGIFMLLRLPNIIDLLSPLCLVLILFYWVLATPQYVNVGFAMVVGLILDLVYNITLGEHSLILITLTFFITKLRHKIGPINLVSFETSFMILFIIIIYKFLLFLIHMVLGEPFSFAAALGGAALAALIWMPLSWLLFNYQRKQHI